MKARYNRISKAQYQAIHNEMRSQQEGITRRLMKLVCVVLNESEGFGRDRLRRVLSKVTILADESQDDEIFWGHVDKRMRQLGISESEMADENYKEMGE